MRVMWSVVVSALIAACTPGFELSIGETAIQPYASSGTGGTYLVGSVVALDGTTSFDPDGEITSYHWTVASRPMDGASSIVDATAATTTYALDVAGPHALALTVTDDGGSSAVSAVTFVSRGPELVVDAGADAATAWRTNLGLAGSATVQSGFSLSGVSWAITSGPPSGATLAGPTTLTPTFSCTEEGTYTVRLTASTPYNSASDDLSIDCSAPRQVLPANLVDAEYSLALDRYVLVASGPATLHLHDPASGTSTSVNLSHTPTAVSVSPNGLRAAVGHGGYVSTVNLQTMAVIATYSMTMNVGEIVYGADNRIHCFERAGFTSYKVYTINTTTNAISNNNEIVWADSYTRARLHPAGAKIYGTRTGSPDDIVAYDVATTPVTTIGDSPYHGEYYFGGDLWFTTDGVNIITRSGNVFYSSTNSTIDMTFRLKLTGTATYLGWAVHSAAAGKIATLSSDYTTAGDPTHGFLEIYSPTTFTATSRMNIPPVRDGTSNYDTIGRWAAYRSDGSALYVIARATTPAGPLHTLFPL